MTEPLDCLTLADGLRLAVLRYGDGLSAVPQLRTDRHWVPARPGAGAAEALVQLLTTVSGTREFGAFTVQSWSGRSAAGESPVGVDQTNDSVIVGEAAVVKWCTHTHFGPHPAPGRITTLHANGFAGIPEPWGVVTWRDNHGAATQVAYVDEYLPGAVDGWTWAVDLITAAAQHGRHRELTDAATAVGELVADLHTSLAATAAEATSSDAQTWRDGALAALEAVCLVQDSAGAALARARRDDIAAAFRQLGTLAGATVIEAHGDLHVGQILSTGRRFVVTDFDGNPVLPPAQRIRPVPAAWDVAGMIQSLANAAVVAARHTALDADALRAADRAAQSAFTDAYTRRLDENEMAWLYDPRPLATLRLLQLLREILYAERYLRRWMYVPDAALPDLLDQGCAP